MDYRILQIALKVKSAQKIAKKNFSKNFGEIYWIGLVGASAVLRQIILEQVQCIIMITKFRAVDAAMSPVLMGSFQSPPPA